MAVNVDATLWHDYLGKDLVYYLNFWSLIMVSLLVKSLSLTLFPGGIIQHHCTDTDINHAVQIIGYDETGDDDDDDGYI